MTIDYRCYLVLYQSYKLTVRSHWDPQEGNHLTLSLIQLLVKGPVYHVMFDLPLSYCQRQYLLSGDWENGMRCHKTSQTTGMAWNQIRLLFLLMCHSKQYYLLWRQCNCTHCSAGDWWTNSSGNWLNLVCQWWIRVHQLSKTVINIYSA